MFFNYPTDTTITPEMFAQLTCDDLELPNAFKAVFVGQVKTQIAEYNNHRTEHPSLAEGAVPKTVVAANPGLTPLNAPRRGALDDEDESWWARWRKRIRVNEGGSFVGVGSTDDNAAAASNTDAAADAKAMPPPSSTVRPSGNHKRKTSADGATTKPNSSATSFVGKSVQIVVVEDDEDHNHEMRVLIKLDITVGTVQLLDQFEWDVTDQDASPERFAEIYAADLGLSGEFMLVHAICCFLSQFLY